MKYLSVCSGIEAASCAWRGLGWQAAAYSEIEPFPCAVLNHHFPDTPNWGDMTKWKDWPDATIDILVGGTPCQSFSVAGLRGGLSDPRGGLMLQFLAIADRYKPRWVVWENVPGVLSSNGGRDFGTFLGSLGELGYGWAYRVLDAQWFGVAQRRRRVFVVGCLGDQRSAAAVLFERESVRRDNPPRREAGEGVAGTAGDGTTASGERQWPAKIASTLYAKFGSKLGLENQHINEGAPLFVLMDQGGSVMGTMTDGTVGILRRETHGHEPVVAFAQNQLGEVRTGEVANTINTNSNASGRNTPMVAFPANMSGTQCASTEGVACNLQAKNTTAIAFKPGQSTSARTIGAQEGIACTLEAGGGGNNRQAVAIGTDCYNGAVTGDVAATIGTPGSSVNASGPTVMQSMQVRRLTPEECEKLQGFPPGYTQVPHRGKPAADGPRYKAIGNSMAVPVMRWIGQRIQMVEDVANG